MLGLANPFTLTAAAVGVLGLAYYEGSQEQSEFFKSLTLTSNLVGKTTSQLTDMASRVSAASDVTHGEAASIINQVVASGKVAGDELERVSAAIIQTSEATGIATKQLVSDFDNIAANPVGQISKLNDQYHFLTLATYNQIKALQDEGSAIGAGKTSLDDLDEQMRQAGAKLLRSENTSTKSVDQTNEETMQEQSPLFTMANSLEDALDNIPQIMAEWIGEKDGANADVRTELDVAEQGINAPSALARVKLCGRED